MLDKTITCKDFNGNEYTEVHRFNLTQSELTEMELSVNGGMTEMLNQVINTKDNATTFKIFKNLILKSYGHKSIDGKRFEKSEKLSAEFEQTNAYDTLFMELIQNPEAAAEFIAGIMPGDIDINKVKDVMKSDNPIKAIEALK